MGRSNRPKWLFLIRGLRLDCPADMSTIVKICGITSPADGVMAAGAGADAIGLMFYERSPRNVSIETAAAISRELPLTVLKVGVFVNAARETVLQALGECTLNLLQFHGDESPEYCLSFPVPAIKAFRVRDAKTLEGLSAYRTGAWLLDAHVPDKPGGTGATFNWELALEARKLGTPIFLAGGLTPENVADAIRTARPYGVDVSTGVESAPGKKDPAKVRAFIQAAKSAA
jgi:phosphoribosylanthranilate isomerase